MKIGQFAVFLAIVLSIWGLMHAYVCWRAWSLPWIQAHLSKTALLLGTFGLWAFYPLARMSESVLPWGLARTLEFAAAMYLGVMFLIVMALLVLDVVTLGGWIAHPFAPRLRTAAFITAVTLAFIASVQGLRPPVVREHEIYLKNLPAERNGTVLLFLSDMHLGSLIGAEWLEPLAERVQRMRPDVIVLVGDILDGSPGRIESLMPGLKKLNAPLGVWAVTGNHEYYAGLDRCVSQMERAGLRVLRDRSVEIAPGLVLAGVDDFTARPGGHSDTQPLERALANRPPGATVLLSHTPWHTRAAARLGADLMLSGHTHDGQIWPFNFFVKTRYPKVAGRYEIDGMQLLVCRGTGTWGPRMRLWRPSEMLRLTLRSGVSPAAPSLPAGKT